MKNSARQNLLRLPEVKARTGKSTSGIYECIQAGTFPKPVKIGPRASAWVDCEVSEWIAERVTERDNQGAA